MRHLSQSSEDSLVGRTMVGCAQRITPTRRANNPNPAYVPMRKLSMDELIAAWSGPWSALNLSLAVLFDAWDHNITAVSL